MLIELGQAITRPGLCSLSSTDMKKRHNEEKEKNSMDNFKVQAMIHSLKNKDEATIISHKDNNNVVAEYKGQRCTAIYNVFNGLYYVDDIYGKLPA